MAGRMHFGDFNPLDVLATAASMQSIQCTSDEEGRGGHLEESSGEAAEDSEDTNNDKIKIGQKQRDSLPKENGYTPIANRRDSGIAESPIAGRILLGEDRHNGDLLENGVVPRKQPVKSMELGTSSNMGGASCVIKVVTSADRTGKLINSQPLVSLKDATQVIVPSKDGGSKTVKVFKISKPQSGADHSYSFFTQFEKSRCDEDEGYSSRSSLDSPGVSYRSDQESGEHEVFSSKEAGGSRILKSPISPTFYRKHLVDLDKTSGLGTNRGLRSPPPLKTLSGPIPLKSPLVQTVVRAKNATQTLSNMNTTPSHSANKVNEIKGKNGSIALSQTTKKPAKIVIVSRDSNLHKLIGAKEKLMLSPPGSSSDGNIVLRSLLGHRAPQPSKSQVKNHSTPHMVRVGSEKLDKPAGIVTHKESELVLSPSSNVEHKPQVSMVSVQQTKATHSSISRTQENHRGDTILHEVHPGLPTEHRLQQLHAFSPNNVKGSVNESLSGMPVTTESVPKAETITSPPQSKTQSVQIKSPTISGSLQGNSTNTLKALVIDTSNVHSPCTQTLNTVSDTSNNLLLCVQDKTDNPALQSQQDQVLKGSRSNTVAPELYKLHKENSITPFKVDNGMNDRAKITIQDKWKLSSSGKQDVASSEVLSSSKSTALSPGIKSDNTDCQLVAVNEITPMSNNNNTLLSDSTEEEIDVVTIDDIQETDNMGITSHRVGTKSPSASSLVTKVSAADVHAGQLCASSMIAVNPASLPAATSTVTKHVVTSTTGDHVVKRSMPQSVSTSVGPTPGHTAGLLTAISQPPVLLTSTPKVGVAVSMPDAPQGTVTLLITSGSSQQLKLLSASNNQYIIQDDIPPVARYSSGLKQETLTSPSSHNINHTQVPTDKGVAGFTNSAPKDRWKLLGSMNNKAGILTTSASSKMGVAGQSGIQTGLVLSNVGPIMVAQPGARSGSLASTTQLAFLPVSQTKVPTSVGIVSANKAGKPLATATHLRLQTKTDLSKPTIVLKSELAYQSEVDIQQQINSSQSADLLDGVLMNDMANATKNDPEPETIIKSEQLDFGSTGGTVQIEDDTSCIVKTEAGNTDAILSCSPVPSNRGLSVLSGRITPLEALEASPTDTINVKISGNKVLDVTNDQVTPVRIEKTSIGTVGSLSFKNLAFGDEGGSMPLGGVVRPVLKASVTPAPVTSGLATLHLPEKPPPNQNSLTDLLNSRTPKPSYIGNQVLRLNDPFLGVSARTSCHNYDKKKQRSRMMHVSAQDLRQVKRTAQLISQLHPLIDHDYCGFAEYSAEIQSSIIATTETKLKNEREKKNSKKAKAARTKAGRGLAVPLREGRHGGKVKRKYVRRKPLKSELIAQAAALAQAKAAEQELFDSSDDNLEEKLDPQPLPDTSHETLQSFSLETLEKEKGVRHSERKVGRPKVSPLKNYNSDNFVKIPGSFQNEFVYFATKKLERRGTRTRKIAMIDPAQVVKQPSVGGISIFDWYKDLSHADKGFKFGISGAKEQVGNMPTKCLTVSQEETVSSRVDSLSVLSATGPSRTPLHESEVADMVMDMMPNGGLDIPGFSAAFQSDTDQNGANSKTSDTDVVDLNAMVEQVKTMLNSMGEADLRSTIERLGTGEGESVPSAFTDAPLSHTGDSIKDTTKEPVTSQAEEVAFNNLLPSFSQVGAATNISQGAQLLSDLDDINDSDLLPTDLAVNMNMVLGDLGTPVKSSVATSVALSDTKMSHPVTSLSNVSPIKHTNILLSDAANQSPLRNYTTTLDELKPENDVPSTTTTTTTISSNVASHSFGRPLDQMELFPDMTAPERPVVSDSNAPELTVLSMYWNDLPGLVIHGRKHVRLVDIHKQILPAKDTGILKKRCQMMNLELVNCTELQRDFLIRYANAAKSKSTVVVPSDDAKTLIGFYVDPRPRCHKHREAMAQRERLAAEEAAAAARAMEKAVEEEKRRKLAEKERPVIPVIRRKSVEKPPPVHISIPELATKTLVEEKSEYDSDTEVEEPAPVSTSTSKQHLRRSIFSGARRLDTSAIRLGRPLKRAYRKRKLPLTLPRRQLLPKSPQKSDTEYQTVAHISPMKDLKRSERLRHKKVTSYAAMVQGNYNDIIDEDNGAPAAKQARKSNVAAVDDDDDDDDDLDSDEENLLDLDEDRPRKMITPEEREYHKLREKQKRRRLTRKDRRRLKNLRENLKYARYILTIREERLRKKREREKLRRLKMKAKQVNGRHKYLEHPYAAAPNVTIDHVNVEPDFVESEDAPLTVGEVCLVSPVIKCEVAPKECSVELEKESLLELVHRDSLHRNGQRGRSQDGDLHLHLYESKDSPCIQCCTCLELFNVRKFLKHTHHLNNADELLDVFLPQRLELRSSKPTDEETSQWDRFEKVRQSFEKDPKASDKDLSKHKSSVVRAVDAQIKKLNQKSIKAEKEEATALLSSSTRQSSRVRKRKQLHPIEKYVYSKLLPSNEPEHKLKKAKFDPEMELSETRLGELEQRLLPSEMSAEIERMSVSVSPVNQMKAKFANKKESTAGREDKKIITKYDLRVPGSPVAGQEPRHKVLTKQIKACDSKLTALQEEEKE